jgi:hypothetical protein
MDFCLDEKEETKGNHKSSQMANIICVSFNQDRVSHHLNFHLSNNFHLRAGLLAVLLKDSESTTHKL